jgi:hypothetical protein
MPFSGLIRAWMLAFAAMAVCSPAVAQTPNAPVSLVWITNSSVKLEQIIGDVDWAALAHGTNLPTASRTATRFHILGNGLGYSFEDNGKLIFLFGDTISEDQTNINYHAADPLAWSTNTDGETPLVLNFFTNAPPSKFVSIFVQPSGIKMGPFDVPNSGISLSNRVFLVCNTGSDGNLPNPQTNDFSELVTFNETNLPFSTNTFVTNRVVSMLNTNYDPNSPLQGHFINTSMHEYGTNVMMFGTGEYRSGDVFLCMIPTANFATGDGTLYFAGLTNGQPDWSNAESNCVPVVQDNPTNGPAWPNDSGTAGNVSVTHPPALGLWLMTYDGGRSGDSRTNHTTGVYFSYASQPWGPWSKPQLIFNKLRDGGSGVFIHDPGLPYDDRLDGPVIGFNDPYTIPGGDFAPIMIERFTRITNSTLFIYYTMSTWNPYTVVKMRSAFTIVPKIDPGTLVHKRNKFSFAWTAPTNESFQVDYSDVLPPVWATFTNVITATNGGFNFTDDESLNGGLGPSRFFRLRRVP